MAETFSRVVSALPTGTAVARYIQALALGVYDYYAATQRAETWRDTPQVKAAFVDLQTKSAVAPGLTTDSTWAAPLAQDGIAGEAVTLVRGMTILGALEGRMQKVPMHVKIPVETDTAAVGGWVPEGGPVPFGKTTFTTSIEENYKFGFGDSLTEELVKTSDPAALPTINRLVLGKLAKGIDTQLLTPTVALSAGVNPASVLNGGTAITSTGSTATAIKTDLRAMRAAVTTQGPYVWIMQPRTRDTIAMELGADVTGLPANLYGSPVIASVNSPQQIALLDPSFVLYSDSGQFDLDASRYATPELNDAPANPGTSTTIMTSLCGNEI